MKIKVAKKCEILSKLKCESEMKWSYETLSSTNAKSTVLVLSRYAVEVAILIYVNVNDFREKIVEKRKELWKFYGKENYFKRERGCNPVAHYGAAVTLTTGKNEISSLTNSGMSVAFTARNLKRNENQRIIYSKKFKTK